MTPELSPPVIASAGHHRRAACSPSSRCHHPRRFACRTLAPKPTPRSDVAATPMSSSAQICPEPTARSTPPDPGADAARQSRCAAPTPPPPCLCLRSEFLARDVRT
ncbi:hypothetical protein ACJRO7_015425 [Eucalyptus globulus]|uniref:Uncharacterized protein n=1 Tax=Eucalyptus globulus TaxID=34317 RepID=A0ABD3L4H3_EUCGL